MGRPTAKSSRHVRKEEKTQPSTLGDEISKRKKKKRRKKKKKHSVLLNRMVIAFLDSYVMETLWFSQSQWNSETVVLASVLKDQQKKK